LGELDIAVPSLKKQQQILEIANLSSQEQKLLCLLANKKKQYIETLLIKHAKGE